MQTIYELVWFPRDMSTSKFEIYMSRKKTIYRFHLNALKNFDLGSKISKFNSHALHMDMLIELAIKYRNEVGSKSPNGQFLDCKQYFLEGFFEFKAHTCFIFLTSMIFSFSVSPICTYILLLLSPLLYSANRITLKKITQYLFQKIVTPKQRKPTSLSKVIHTSVGNDKCRIMSKKLCLS